VRNTEVHFILNACASLHRARLHSKRSCLNLNRYRAEARRCRSTFRLF